MGSDRDWETRIARLTGGALLATIVFGIVVALTLAPGLDVNLSGDVGAVTDAMYDGGDRLVWLAWAKLGLFAVEMLALCGIYILLRRYGPLLSLWSLVLGAGGLVLSGLAAMLLMNAAEMVGSADIAPDAKRAVVSAQIVSHYTSFHIALVLSALVKLGFFILFWTSGIIPKWIAGLGLFASLFVALAIVGRDFIPALRADAVTAVFMLSNLAALLALGVYLIVKGVRPVSPAAP